MVPLTGLPTVLEQFFPLGSIEVEAPNLPDIVNKITIGWKKMDVADKDEMITRLRAQPEVLMRLLDLDKACLLVLLNLPPFQ